MTLPFELQRDWNDLLARAIRVALILPGVVTAAEVPPAGDGGGRG
ncbi:MAG TPA: hypothetical protein VM778_10430 [Gemmatimonadota bacterium]|nr:hypothetical protein [Gemmatimonadota bacterium]